MSGKGQKLQQKISDNVFLLCSGLWTGNHSGKWESRCRLSTLLERVQKKIHLSCSSTLGSPSSTGKNPFGRFSSSFWRFIPIAVFLVRHVSLRFPAAISCVLPRANPSPLLFAQDPSRKFGCFWEGNEAPLRVRISAVRACMVDVFGIRFYAQLSGRFGPANPAEGIVHGQWRSSSFKRSYTLLGAGSSCRPVSVYVYRSLLKFSEQS